MRCPNLIKKDAFHCMTVDDSYRPSQYQLMEYCKERLHSICPFYLGYQKRQAQFQESLSAGGLR